MDMLERLDAQRSRRRARSILYIALMIFLWTGVAGAYADQTMTEERESPEAAAASRAQEDALPPLRTDDPAPPTGTSPPIHTDDGESWMLTLVNAEHPLPEGHSVELRTMPNGLSFDERAADQLSAMLAAARAQGLSPVLCSAYRSVEAQDKLYRAQVNKLTAKGLDQAEAEAVAGTIVAYPGTSEHNLGLAVDLVSLRYQLLNEAQADTPEIKWLTAHCAEYGFILRYPKNKTEITGIIYEPWHFRYVGAEAAAEIMERGICLEEYLGE